MTKLDFLEGLKDAVCNTCNDDKKNGDEYGIDCGGSCAMCTVTIKAWGGGGGAGERKHGSAGGAGGYAQCDFIIEPNEELTICVGGAGTSAHYDQIQCAHAHVGSPGGYPNGGNGEPDYCSGGGGGSSHVLSKLLGDKVVMGAGGGGAGPAGESNGGGGGGGGGPSFLVMLLLYHFQDTTMQ